MNFRLLTYGYRVALLDRVYVIVARAWRSSVNIEHLVVYIMHEMLFNIINLYHKMKGGVGATNSKNDQGFEFLRMTILTLWNNTFRAKKTWA